jgi:hypothetical protein
LHGGVSSLDRRQIELSTLRTVVHPLQQPWRRLRESSKGASISLVILSITLSDQPKPPGIDYDHLVSQFF